MKRIAQGMLLTFVLGALAYYVWSRVGETRNLGQIATDMTNDPMAEATARAAVPTVVVTYFTTDVRCESCLAIEKLTRAAIADQFGDEMSSGQVRFQTLNLDLPQKKHFARDYEIAFKTVVVTQEASGKVLRWEKRDDVWKLLRAPDQFKSYIALLLLKEVLG